MEKNCININAGEITIKYKNNACIPQSPEILRLVGLSPLAGEIETLYGFISNYNGDGLIKWAAYQADLKADEAKKRLLRYFIIEVGIRIKYAQNISVADNEWLVWRSNILIIDENITDDMILRYLESDGFI